MDYTTVYLAEVGALAAHLDTAIINRMVDLLLETRARNGRVFFLGVGGGAGHAGHAVNDFRKIAGIESYAPTDNVSELTAHINDDGWDSSYSNWLIGSHLSASDTVFVFSVGGGNAECHVSMNLVASLELAHQVGASILFAERRSLLRPSRLAALALFVFVLTMSGSRGAWMIETALMILWLLLTFARRAGQRVRLALAVAAPVASIALGAVLILGYQQLVPLLGRDATLTGRTAIWTQVARFIAQRPLFGYGYDAFWRGMQGPSLQVAAAVHFIVAHAHNGFLEIALELGAAGLLLFVLSWLRGWGALWPLWQRGAIDRIAWPLAILVLIALYDLDENTLLIYNGLFWILYVAALTSIELAAEPALSESARRASRTGDLHHTRATTPREILSTVSSRALSVEGTQSIPQEVL